MTRSFSYKRSAELLFSKRVVKSFKRAPPSAGEHTNMVAMATAQYFHIRHRREDSGNFKLVDIRCDLLPAAGQKSLFKTFTIFWTAIAAMSALTDRDTNLQSNSHPASTEKQSAAGEENKSQESQQHRQVLEQKIAENNGYVRRQDS